MVTQRDLLLRSGQLAALFVMFCLGLLDLAGGLLTGSEGIGLLRVLTALATAVVWLPRHRQGSARLPRQAIVLALASLFVTFLSAAGASGGGYGFAETLGLLGVVYVVCRRGEPQWATGAVLALGMAIGFLPLRDGTNYERVIIGLVQGLVATAVIGAAVYVRTIEANRRRVMDSVRAEQRAEFARDLHDFIAHHVTGIVVQAQGARYIAEQDPQRAIDALERIEAAGAETMASMRRMVGVLRDPQTPPDAPLAPLAGVDELKPLIEQFTAAGGPLARLHVEGGTGGLPVEVSTSAYRVVMEALTNIRRHARGARVADVWVRRTPEWLLVRVANDGLEATPGPREAPGYGLVGLQERVRAVGGRITAGPGIDGGWVVDAALPLDRDAAW
ncbi:sensor histidine kinase [Actinoplanes sp. N902-109]|uniref:sensor histidine kinase n=1 Tax=Actinoplanes sp. (strain N902-109) TaxID=649831 RepID=UPI0003296167|nr:histidine kinase [Actinoplanes sp. N902-109]AGL18477.1 integral membrane sensor signal transduction histidine kinase [Actinoplanes sp. N902-109]